MGHTVSMVLSRTKVYLWLMSSFALGLVRFLNIRRIFFFPTENTLWFVWGEIIRNFDRILFSISWHAAENWSSGIHL